jgi:S1-C subfamily serine protease
MFRACRIVGLALLLCLPGRLSADDESPRLREIEDGFQAAIRKAEPSVACILVARSDIYQRWFGETPDDDPCKLGSFEPLRVALRVPADDLPQYEELKKSLEKRQLRPVLDEEIKKRFDLADPGYVPESYGSGVAINNNGLVLTNYHVIRGATKIFVRFPGGKGSYADIHAAEPRCDLAVLRLLDPDLRPPALKRGDGGKLRKGQFVLSLANPFAVGSKDGSPSASWGIVSNLRRQAGPPIAWEHERSKIKLQHFETLIQTDARLNLGCSGGALINLKGEMVGLTTALAAVQGGETAGGYAIPMDEPNRGYIEQLEKGLPVEFGFLGVSFQFGGGGGIDVIPGSAAERAGLRRGARIVRVNDTAIRDNDDLFVAISRLRAGDEARLEVENGGIKRVHTATLDKLYVPGRVYASQRPAAVRGMRVDFTSVVYQRDRLNQGIPRGVFVSEVQSNSAADQARLQDAIITRINGQDVDSPTDFYRRAAQIKGPMELTIINRNEPGGVTTVKLN